MGPHKKDYSILGSILGYLNLGKLPYNAGPCRFPRSGSSSSGHVPNFRLPKDCEFVPTCRLGAQGQKKPSYTHMYCSLNS